MSTGLTETVSDEKVVLRGLLHSELLAILLLGMYTPLYFGTMYIYITGKSSKHHIVIAATTILFGVNVFGGVLVWQQLPILIGSNGQSISESLSEQTAASNGSNPVLFQLLGISPFIVADGLLIWRCFKIWSDSLRVIAMPMILLLAETADVVYANVVTTEAAAVASNHLQSAALFTTLAVTFWTTALIAYRIYSTANLVLDRKKSRFYNILEITMQSSLIYSLVLVPSAATYVIPDKQSNFIRLFTAANYLSAIITPITGIAPTIMVARITLASKSDSNAGPTTIGVSDIQFGEQHRNINITRGVSPNVVLREQDNET